MPLLVAPVAFQRLVDPDGEVAMARAAAAAGTIMCLSTIATSRPSEIAAEAPPAPRWFQLYCFRDRGVTRALIDEAVESGFDAIALTVDAPRAGRRERDFRTGFEVPAEVNAPAVAAAVGSERAITVQEVFALVDPVARLGRLRRRSPRDCSLPVLLKGVQTGEDARLAVEHGAAGVIVSNHGGRQLDGVAATLELLPEVVEAVGGRCEVLIDGGIRRGTDVVDRARARRAGGARGPGAALGPRGRRRGGRAAGARAPARRDRAGADAARLPDRPARACAPLSTSRGRARSVLDASNSLRWPNDTHARRRCAGSTAPGRCSPPPTATSAPRSTTRSGWSRSTRSG